MPNITDFVTIETAIFGGIFDNLSSFDIFGYSAVTILLGYIVLSFIFEFASWMMKKGYHSNDVPEVAATEMRDEAYPGFKEWRY